MTKLIPRSFYDNQSELFIQDIQTNEYYVFFGNHMNVINSHTDSVDSKDIAVFQNMIYGKVVANTDVIPLIHKNLYTSNKIYDMYDSQADLSNNNFYTIVNEASAYHVFKCLNNANRSPSLFPPSFADIDPIDEIYITSDNYVWKYMYSVPGVTYTKFSTTDYFPVVANTTTENNARNRSIDVIAVDFEGKGYDNYCNGIFRNSDIKINGNPLMYSISASAGANTSNNFYNDCYITISSGTGVGQYAKISNYISNSTSKTITIDRQFTTELASDSTYEVAPGVVIKGDGYQTVNADARAIVNTAGNTVSSIEMLNTGLNYNFANAYIQVSDVVGVTSNAIIRVINSPPGGHGKNPITELNSSAVCISAKFSNADIDIPKTNIYSEIGLIKDPIFNTTTINLANVQNIFIGNEPLFNIDRILISNSATTTALQNNVSAPADFLNQLSQGEYVYITDGVETQISVVSSITNSSYFTLTSNAYFTGSSVKVYKTLANASFGTVTGVSTGSLDVANITDNTLQTGNFIIGLYSGATGVITNILRSNVLKNLNTFVQMYKYIGTRISGSFIENEEVFQSPTGLLVDAFATGTLHSSIVDNSNITIYVTNNRGVFTAGSPIYAVMSGASMSLSTKYPSEIVPLSGDILYVENIEPITRTNEESENIKLIFEF